MAGHAATSTVTVFPIMFVSITCCIFVLMIIIVVVTIVASCIVIFIY